ncbi:MAG: YrdB family protein [Anaerolineae bacterium]|nr:YrdB family protein [Anaerolineae bacterium]
MLKPLNLALRFLLEICLLIALGYWGFSTQSEIVPKILLGIGAPLIAAIVWGVLLAPASNRRLADPLRLLAEIVIFAVGALALAAAGQPRLAVIFAVVALVNMILLRVWHQ